MTAEYQAPLPVDISHIVCAVQELVSSLEYTWSRPHVVMRPRVFKDGDAWCALYGEDLQVGVAGFGDSPKVACEAFDREWRGMSKDDC